MDEMINAPHCFSFPIRQTKKSLHPSKGIEEAYITSLGPLLRCTMPLNEPVQPMNVSCLGLLTSKSANGTPITVRTLTPGIFFSSFTSQKSPYLCLFPGICSWRGTSGCSINITSGPKRHMTPEWTFQRRRLRHFTISHTLRRLSSVLLPFWHTAARP